MNLNDMDNLLNNKTVSESVYYQYNTICINKQHLNNNKNNIKNKEPKKHINNNRKRSLNNSVDYKINQNEKFSETYKRFLDGQKKKKDKINEMKKNKEEKEKNLCYNKPKINKKSQEIASKNKENFYERQKKLMEEKKKKEVLLKEKIRKKEIDDINKTNILLTHNKEKNKNKRKNSMDDAVKKMYEWDEKRKEKLVNKIKNKEKSMKDNIKNKPKIDKNSYLITVNRNPNHIFNRLYIDDVLKRKEKKKLLDEIYTPSFRPNLRKVESPRKKYSSCMNSRLNTINSNTIQTDKKVFNEESDEGNEPKNISIIHDDEEVCDIIRSHIFKKKKNKIRYNSSENSIKKSVQFK
jgi:hypothetical protein